METKRSTEVILNQLLELLDNLSDKHYNKNLEIFTNACIGNHVRHITELFEVLQTAYDTSIISYCSLNQLCGIEKDKKEAIRVIRQFREKLDVFDLKRPLTLKSYLAGKENDPALIESTFERELAYCLENTMHHMVIIRTGVCIHWPDMPIPMNFGQAVPVHH